MNGLGLEVSNPCNTLHFFRNLLLKFKVGFYRRGDLTRASLIAECVVEAVDIGTAKSAALTQLTPQHPDVVDCRYWHAAGYEAPRARPRW